MDTERTAQERESQRIERLWGGEFGAQYTRRNLKAGETRESFWRAILGKYQARSVLEVGCNLGANLGWIAPLVGPSRVWGVDINRDALKLMHKNIVGVGAAMAAARLLPFRGGQFDLVFTMGVLIHQPPPALPSVMAEIVRCSSRYILCGEYYSEQTVEVPYRGQSGALFKRDFGGTYQELWPDLSLREKGFLSREQGFDDMTYWVFEKPGGGR